jgi:hypothetical protein
MPITVIKHYGRPKEAIDLNGQRIERKDVIYVKTHKTWYPTLDYDNHFVYMSNRVGSTMMCTCGSAAGVIDYHLYKKYQSRYEGPIIACLFQIQSGHHADGST